MDAFYASVEMRDNPDLRGKPLIIGSLPSERGVVATASYEARKYGVHSAMNIKDAYRLCPNGIYMHPNMDKYKAVSMSLHKIWHEYAAALEGIAYDEAYLDVTERARNINGARTIAHEIKRRIRDELYLTCSVGVGYSKSAAKTASEEKKPDGYYEILTPDDYVALIVDRDVRTLYTVGIKTAEKLHTNGINTVRDIREKSDEVIRLLGKQGVWITRLAYGIDNRTVTPYSAKDAKTIGREVTFQEDVDNYALLGDILLILSLSVVKRARRAGLYGGGVTLKITYADMKSISRSQAGFVGESAYEIYKRAGEMMEKVEHRPVRLIGVGIYNLTDGNNRQLTLDDLSDDKACDDDAQLKGLLKEIAARYGLEAADYEDAMLKGEHLYRTIEYMRKQ